MYRERRESWGRGTRESLTCPPSGGQQLQGEQKEGSGSRAAWTEEQRQPQVLASARGLRHTGRVGSCKDAWEGHLAGLRFAHADRGPEKPRKLLPLVTECLGPGFTLRAGPRGLLVLVSLHVREGERPCGAAGPAQEGAERVPASQPAALPSCPASWLHGRSPPAGPTSSPSLQRPGIKASSVLFQEVKQQGSSKADWGEQQQRSMWSCERGALGVLDKHPEAGVSRSRDPTWPHFPLERGTLRLDPRWG
ncbi:uncharacterized protein LOC117062872 [Trachypithecus francoisi]|uniref:uncharacterized protein LOC117062872 n=1 Tax=Trachypithecus francoisi TaxID=54180 RepID=UPI00141BE41F|nr:uncharacterized protein LOC117062872 [Trachypithecus francoisi]